MSETEKDEPRTEIARRVFDHWKLCMKRPRANLDDKRMRLICSRLSDGYSEEDLKLAAYGVSKSRWHQGENDRRLRYISVELIYRDADHVDRYVELGEQTVAREKRQVQIERERVVESIERSTTGNVYKANRDSLLRIVRKA